jgi:hypothetical protein
MSASIWQQGEGHSTPTRVCVRDSKVGASRLGPHAPTLPMLTTPLSYSHYLSPLFSLLTLLLLLHLRLQVEQVLRAEGWGGVRERAES